MSAQPKHVFKTETSSLPKISIANNGDGETIAALLKEVGWDVQGVDINWHDIFPFWLKAELDGEIIGCLQVSVSKPVGRLEFLAVKEGLSHQLHAMTVKALGLGGDATLRAHGSTLTASTVSFDRKSFKRVMKRRGYMVIGSGNVFLKRLT